MDLDSRLTHVSVVGAAGKMGSGIALLLAQEMARLSYLPEHKDTVFRLDVAITLQDGIEKLDQGDVDVLLLDLSLPDSRGLDTFTRACEAAPTVTL